MKEAERAEKVETEVKNIKEETKKEKLDRDSTIDDLLDF